MKESDSIFLVFDNQQFISLTFLSSSFYPTSGHTDKNGQVLPPFVPAGNSDHVNSCSHMGTFTPAPLSHFIPAWETCSCFLRKSHLSYKLFLISQVCLKTSVLISEKKLRCLSSLCRVITTPSPVSSMRAMPTDYSILLLNT